MSIPSAPPALERPRTTFTIPKGSRVFPGDPTTVTFSPVTARQEIDASRAAIVRGGGTDASLTFELCRRSIVAVDGKEVDWSDGGKTGGVDSDWIDGTSPQCRALLSIAFVRANRPLKTDEDAFLASASTDVG
jgi:hypothetical protein